MKFRDVYQWIPESWTPLCAARGDRMRFALVAVMVVANTAVSFAETAPLTLTAQVTEPTPQQDDATLHDVALVGPAGIWAVGDHGAIWKSTDGGATWSFLSVSPLLERYQLRSVCFLTDRVGWIAGGTVLPVGGIPCGVVLATRDGGATWSIERTMNLPYLNDVRFFDLENGIAVGDRSVAFPSGVIVTSDGGATWTPMSSARSARWNTAACVSSQSGLLAGEQGTQGVISRGSIVDSGPTASGLRAFHGASLDAQGRAWLAGDGCYLFRSDNAGVSWHPIHPQLPPELEDFSNFRSVAHIENHAWVAGSPGSVIWHTSDAGNSWQAQATGDRIPLEAVRFLSPFQGAAVGHLGRICVTQDGGETWKSVRGKGRRLSCLAIQTHAERTALSFLTRWAAEEGYRTGVMISTRRDTGSDAYQAQQLDLRLAHAVQTAGGNRGWIDWRLPIGLPDLEKDREKLIREWTLLTDKRLAEVLLESLVAEIRIWRPEVLLIDEPSPGEFAAELIQRAVTRAMQQAATAEFGTDQQQLAGLAPWQVRKLVMQKRPGTKGPITQDPLEVLPHLGKTLELAVSEALGQLGTGTPPLAATTDSLVLRVTDASLSEKNVFRDLGLVPGGDARRAKVPITSSDFEKLIAEANHRRTVTAISERMTASPERAGQLLGQLKEILSPLSPEQAAQQLAVLGRQYHQRGEWSLAESVYAELISRHPDQPVAVDAMLWLMQYWTSAEMNWQRLRTMQATGTLTQAAGGMSPEVAQARLEEAITVMRQQKTKTAATLNTPSLTAAGSSQSQPIALAQGSLQNMMTPGAPAGNQYEMQLERWQRAALSVISGLRDGYPQIFEKPEIQFVTAALYRRRNDHRKADEIYDRFLKTISDDPWNIAARGEAYLLRPGVQSPKPVIACKTTRIPPILDGILSDDCWRDATEIRLGDQSIGETFIGAATQQRGAASPLGTQPVVFLAHDDKYLYLAASVPIHAELPTDPPERAGRQHDADLDRFDRISIQIDVDRDYGSYYRFDIDQRGQTRESCWENWGYNPTWYCATTREVDAWRLECAIPLEELLPPERLIGTSWGVGITRILPGLGAQSWTAAGATTPQPALFGLMRFE